MTTGPAESSAVADIVGTWNVEPATTTIEFYTKAMWVFPVKGRFRALSGSGTVSDDGSVTGTLTIDATSVDTGNRRRDDHLRTADFFEAEAHPALTFELLRATVSEPGRAILEGSLTVKGVTRSLQASASFGRSGDAVDVDAEVSDVDRRDWGLTWAKMGAGVHNRLAVHAHLVRA